MDYWIKTGRLLSNKKSASSSAKVEGSVPVTLSSELSMSQEDICEHALDSVSGGSVSRPIIANGGSCETIAAIAGFDFWLYE